MTSMIEAIRPWIKCLLNGPMIVGAISGYLIFCSYGGIQGTWRHEGGGPVYTEYDDKTRWVSERELKREEYVKWAILGLTGGLFWIVGAIHFRANYEERDERNT